MTLNRKIEININILVSIAILKIFSKNIKKIKPVSEDENVIMITFSNNISLKSEAFQQLNEIKVEAKKELLFM